MECQRVDLCSEGLSLKPRLRWQHFLSFTRISNENIFYRSRRVLGRLAIKMIFLVKSEHIKQKLQRGAKMITAYCLWVGSRRAPSTFIPSSVAAAVLVVFARLQRGTLPPIPTTRAATLRRVSRSDGGKSRATHRAIPSNALLGGCTKPTIWTPDARSQSVSAEQSAAPGTPSGSAPRRSIPAEAGAVPAATDRTATAPIRGRDSSILLPDLLAFPRFATRKYVSPRRACFPMFVVDSPLPWVRT